MLKLFIVHLKLLIADRHLLILISLSVVSTPSHIKNFFTSIGDPDDIAGDGSEVLKMAISHKYIRYFIEKKATSTISFYGDYALHSVSGIEDLAEQLTNILSKDTFLSRAFASVKICWVTDFEIIPAVFFDEKEIAPYTAFNPIMDGEASFIFEVPEPINDLLKSKFNAIGHYHSGSVLIEKLRKEGLAKSDGLFINIQAESVEIVFFDGSGSLRIYNRYDYKAYQDYIYFVLLVADEMGINREEVKAVLMGEVSQDSQLYEITYRYFRNIVFVNQPGDIHFSRAFEGYPKYFNYQLYNL